MLHADPTSRSDQIDNFTPEHQIRFGNVEYVADTWGDPDLAGFTTPFVTLAGLAMLALESPSDPI